MTETISKKQLAREMLEKAASEWQKTSKGGDDLDFFISDIDGEINIGLEFKTAHGPTSIIFNPQATVEELVEKCQQRLERLGLWENEHLRERLLRIQVKGSIAAMLAVVRPHFEDSIWEMPLVVSTLYDWAINPHHWTWHAAGAVFGLVGGFLLPLFGGLFLLLESHLAGDHPLLETFARALTLLVVPLPAFGLYCLNVAVERAVPVEYCCSLRQTPEPAPRTHARRPARR